MHKSHWAVALGAVVSIAAFSLSGCSAATSKAAVASHTSVAATTEGSSGTTENTHILVYSVNTDGADFRAIIAGSIGDYGPAETVYPNGESDTSHSHQLELKLTRGSFRINIAKLDKAFVEAAGAEPIYPQTCSDFASVTTSTPIVAHSGTGSYQGISGSFKMTVTLNEVEAPSCKPGSPGNFVAQVISISGSGDITS
jgi:hypothetical protein